MKKKAQKRRIQKLLEGSESWTSTTKSLDRLPESIAGRIRDAVTLASDEESLLASALDAERWCLLTTDRLVWLQEGMLRDLAWHDIRCAQQSPTQSARIIRGELQKNQISDLEIFDSRDTKYTFYLEASGYYIVWSAILAFCNYTRRPDPIDLSLGAS